jgi:hypothetical protein
VYPGAPFQNDMQGGGNIIIPFLQSPNYVPLVSGWRISRNGDAEFASGTFRGPLLVVNPLTGLVVASISNTGNIAGQYASIENDIILQGQSLGDRLSDGRGLVAFWGTFLTPAAPGVSGAFTNTAWFNVPIKTDRVYFITCTPLNVVMSGASFTAGLQTQWAYTDTGGGSGVFGNVTQGVGNNSTLTADSFLPQGLLWSIGPTPDVTATFQLQSTQSSNNLTYNNIGGWNLLAYDVGSFAAAMNVGNLGTAAGAVQRTTRYDATLSQSYNGSGNQIVSTDLWRSNFGDGNGQTTSLCIFPGATMRTDFGLGTGATIQSATLTMFCTTAEETNGSMAFDPSTAVAIPGTQASFSGGTYPFSDLWPNPGWFTVNILGDFLDDIINSGANAMKISAAFTGGAATRFAGASVANRPYITVTYTK